MDSRKVQGQCKGWTSRAHPRCPSAHWSGLVCWRGGLCRVGGVTVSGCFLHRKSQSGDWNVMECVLCVDCCGCTTPSPHAPFLRCLSRCYRSGHAEERRVHSVSPVFLGHSGLSPHCENQASSSVTPRGCSGERAARPRPIGLSVETLKGPQGLAQGPAWSEGSVGCENDAMIWGLSVI